VLWRGIVNLHLQETHAFFLLKDLVHVLLAEREVFEEFETFAEAVDRLLEMLGN
jgi:hypothetical protein